MKRSNGAFKWSVMGLTEYALRTAFTEGQHQAKGQHQAIRKDSTAAFREGQQRKG